MDTVFLDLNEASEEGSWRPMCVGGAFQISGHSTAIAPVVVALVVIRPPVIAQG